MLVSTKEKIIALGDQMKALMQEDPDIEVMLGFVQYKDRFFTLSFPGKEDDSVINTMFTTSLRFELALRAIREELHDMNLKERQNLAEQTADIIQAFNRLSAVMSEAKHVATEEDITKLIIKCREILNEQSTNAPKSTEGT